ncbi:hypothetical protein BSL78_05956 [Apostichopus japonicus]|uniref:Uncharacterized protein n=1 Tax=Stichopus japonicus TaxID=307972 RepID=A0A2G8LA45_STIJA|nr:hypothetical protein BSL78_05956 [Apostichopus japonicus]
MTRHPGIIITETNLWQLTFQPTTDRALDQQGWRSARDSRYRCQLRNTSWCSEKDQLIQMRIIPYNFQSDSDLSFSSNSSVVVELLPSYLKLLKLAKLTLPHCLVLKKGCEWKAKIYSSHHEEGNQPVWRPQPDTSHVLTERNCEINLKSFSWKKVEVDDKKVKGKYIVLYAAKVLSSSESVTHIHVGYYWDILGCEKIVSMNEVSVLFQLPSVFLKRGKLPLECHFVKLDPPAWTCGSEGGNLKKIPFDTVANTVGQFRIFVLNIKEGTQERPACTCYFEAGQGSKLVELIFILKRSRTLHGECLANSIVYEATVTSGSDSRSYVGLTGGDFKSSYRNHTKSSRNRKHEKETGLSKHIWALRSKGSDNTIEWNILKQSDTHQRESEACNLCMADKEQKTRAGIALSPRQPLTHTPTAEEVFVDQFTCLMIGARAVSCVKRRAEEGAGKGNDIMLYLTRKGSREKEKYQASPSVAELLLVLAVRAS